LKFLTKAIIIAKIIPKWNNYS